jgi:hypothetical protein
MRWNFVAVLSDKSIGVLPVVFWRRKAHALARASTVFTFNGVLTTGTRDTLSKLTAQFVHPSGPRTMYAPALNFAPAALPLRLVWKSDDDRASRGVL